MRADKNELREDTLTFALDISNLCEDIKGCRSYVDQIVRSSSSIGANLYEARYAQSRADWNCSIARAKSPMNNSNL